MTDYTVVLQGLTMGDGTDYPIGEAGISGLGVPKAKTQDTPLDGTDGAFGGTDNMDVRVLLIPIDVNATADSDAWTALDALNAAWAPVDTDVQIDLNLGDFGTVSYMGRPRGLDLDSGLARQGVMTAIGEFDALDPNPI
jgi:hypothetical protein